MAGPGKRGKAALAGGRGKASPRVPRVRKISITVDAGVLREVERDARQSHRTLSAHVSDALARDLRRRRLRDLIAAHEAEHGSITDEELAAIRAEWPD
jgi:hypothetical protein